MADEWINLLINLQTFNHQRFVRAKFYKNGAQVQHPLVSFGSLCPGKRYALLEIKCLLVQLMTQLDVQLVEGECAHYDTLYYGHEILPPVNDVGIFWQKVVPSLSVEIVS